MIKRSLLTFLSFLLLIPLAIAQTGPGQGRLEVLFFGGDYVEESLERYRILKQVLGPRGVNFTFAADASFLTRESLDRYDALLVQGKHATRPLPDAIVPWVRNGGGLVAVHGAGESFPSSSDWAALIGARATGSGEEEFTVKNSNTAHLITNNLTELTALEKIQSHVRHANDLQILQTRPPLKNEIQPEPWTWVRDEGEGRVFYTASGYDGGTWRKIPFQVLVYRGIFWAIGNERSDAFRAFALPELTYTTPDLDDRAHDEVPMLPMQEPLSPAESAAHTQVPAGMRLQLFASEPMIVNPIAIDWDARGRAWVVENLSYPNDIPEETGTGFDKIKILEDTDNDGRADKVTVFADGLRHCTTTVFYAGGVIATDGREIVFLRDENGDDRADTRRVLATGLKIWDTHAATSHFLYGLDNWIYATVGYSGIDMTLNGKRHEFGQSVFRFRPALSELEHLQRTTNNTWGLGFTEEGDVMGSTANNNPSWILSIPGKLYADTGIEQPRTPRADRSTIIYPNTANFTQVDQINRYTAAAGHAFYTDRELSEFLQPNNVFVTEPTGHLVSLGTVVGDGSLKATLFRGNNLYASADAWSAPVAARTGPDGAVWIADWYNPIVQHNVVFRFWNPQFDYDEPHSPYHTGPHEPGSGNAYRTPLRDREHGRIWRIVPEEGLVREADRLDPDDTDSLLAGLRSPSQHTRLHAQRLLIWHKNHDVALALLDLVENETTADGTGKPLAAIHALWTLEGLGALETSGQARATLTDFLATDADPLIRRHVLLALGGNDPAVIHALPDLLASVEDPRERLFVIRAAAESIPHEPTANAIWELATGDADLDGTQREALRLAMHQQRATMLTTVLGNGAQTLPEGWQTETLFDVAARVAAGSGRPALLALLPEISDASRARLAALLKKTGTIEPPKAELPSHLEAGLIAFNRTCVECHQADGRGVPGTYPPLVGDSERAGGSRETILRIVLGGLHGPIEVEGKTYDNVMPGFSFASDEDIASIVSYVRYAFVGKREPPITPAEVKALRPELEARRFVPWTAEELRQAQ